MFEDLEGPYDSILECYVHMASHLVDSKAELQQLYPAASEALLTDAIVYVHVDLRSHNILVKDGQLSGILIGRVQVGYRAIGNCMSCAVFTQAHVENSGS